MEAWVIKRVDGKYLYEGTLEYNFTRKIVYAVMFESEKECIKYLKQKQFCSVGGAFGWKRICDYDCRPVKIEMKEVVENENKETC